MKSISHIQTVRRRGKTVLANCFYTPPFKIADITENKQAGELHLMMMSSSPGVLDTDEYVLTIQLEEASSLYLHTQSYQRFFHMRTGASQSMEVHAGKNSFFYYLPHPAVPHEAADITIKNSIYLSENAALLWGEVLTCGRSMNGEQFRFSKYHNLTEIYQHDKLVIKENIFIVPSETNPRLLGQLEGFTHQASLIYIHHSTDISSAIEHIRLYLEKEQDITAGCTRLPVNALQVRLLGYKAERLYECLQAIAMQLIQIPKPVRYAE